MKILVTGFEPFNGETINPSEQIVHHLIAPKNVTLIKEILPVEFKKSTNKLQELFQEHHQAESHQNQQYKITHPMHG